MIMIKTSFRIKVIPNALQQAKPNNSMLSEQCSWAKADDPEGYYLYGVFRNELGFCDYEKLGLKSFL